jgi:hypothetical protein
VVSERTIKSDKLRETHMTLRTFSDGVIKMSLRILGSAIVAAMLANTVLAQSQPPSTVESGKSLPQAPPTEVISPHNYSEGSQTDFFSPRPDGFRPFIWMSADYSVSAMSRSSLPALVTSSPAGVSQADAGVLGRSTTNVLLGEGPLGSAISNGVRLTAGIGLLEGVTLEFTGFYIRNGPNDFDASSAGNNNSIIARPFFEPITSQPASELVAFPNRFAGSIDVNLRTTLWGVEANVFEKFDLGIPITPGFGLRYANLSDNLQIQQNTTALNAPALTFNGTAIPLSDSVRITDSYLTQNEFIGPQLTLRYEQTFDALTLGVTGKLALGATQQSINIAGQSEHISASGQTVNVASGGFLATSSNIGPYNHSNFSAIPELELKLSYNATKNLNLFISYDFMCWTNVARVGEQISPTVNLTQVPTAAVFNPSFGGPNNPAPLFRNVDLVVNSLRVGLELKY